MNRGPSAIYKAKLAKVREADRKHVEEMTVIAARGGLDLEQMRKLPNGWPDYYRENFIFEHRNP